MLCKVTYFIETDCQPMFNITQAGKIVTVGELDRDSGILREHNGICKLNVTVCYIIMIENYS